VAGISALPASSDAELRGPTNAELFRTIAQLRWRLFANSLRTVRGRLELVSRAFVGLMLAGLAIGGSIGFGIAGYFGAREEQGLYIAAPMVAVFLFWQLYPILGVATSVPFEFGSLLRFPMRFSSFYLLSFAYGFFDPSSLVSALWLLGLLIGIAIALPSLAIWTVPVLLVFAVMNVLLTRAIFVWLERWLAQRKTRELLGALFFVILISFQFLTQFAARWGTRHIHGFSHMDTALFVAKILPPGVASLAILDGLRGDTTAALLELTALAAYALAFATFLAVRLRAQFRGENLSEAAAPVRVRTGQKVRGPWELPGMSGPVAAIFEKESLYLMRSGPMLLTFVMPLFILAMFRFLPGKSGGAGPFTHAPDLAFPIGAAYALLILTNLIYNSFGADGPGIQLYLTAPVRMRDVLLAKNLTHSVLFGIEVLAVLLLSIFLYGPPDPAIIFATFMGVCFALPMNIASGNLMSVYSPRKYDFAMFGRQRATGATAFVSLGVQAIVLGIAALVVVCARLLHRMWLAGVIFIPLAVIAFFLYWTMLNISAERALSRREVLIAEISKT
jgi:ABC-2 type transport system permease protein